MDDDEPDQPAAPAGELITVDSPDGTAIVARRVGQGQPLVLVHGSFGGLDSWDGMLATLAGSFEVWVYARRGYQPSGLGPEPKRFADDVADLAAIVGTTGSAAHVVGASYGGTVSLHAALAHPAMVRSLTVFEAPLYSGGPALQPALDAHRSLIEAGKFSTAARLFAEQVALIPAEILDIAFPAGADEPSSPDPAKLAEAIGCLRDLQAMTDDLPELGRWAGITMPVLLMQGSDTWQPMPASMDALAAMLPHAQRTVFEGQSHFATHTAPALFADRLLAFLNSQ